MTELDLITLVCLQRRYLHLVAKAQKAYNLGHKDEFEMLVPLSKALQKEIEKRFKKIPKKSLEKALKSGLKWALSEE